MTSGRRSSAVIWHNSAIDHRAGSQSFSAPATTSGTTSGKRLPMHHHPQRYFPFFYSATVTVVSLLQSCNSFTDSRRCGCREDGCPAHHDYRRGPEMREDPPHRDSGEHAASHADAGHEVSRTWVLLFGSAKCLSDVSDKDPGVAVEALTAGPGAPSAPTCYGEFGLVPSLSISTPRSGDR